MNILEYLLKANFEITLFLMGYLLIHRRDTLFKWNRAYFLVGTLAILLLPLLNFRVVIPQKSELMMFVPNLNIEVFYQGEMIKQSFWQSLSISDVIICLFLLGIFVMLGRFLGQCYSLFRLKKRATASQISENDVADFFKEKIYFLDSSINPFSFFNWIFINPQLHTEEEFDEIISHERVHIHQWHSIDVILSEILLIILWFNPMAWIWRNLLKQNLEFLTDQEVLLSGINTKKYQHNLLKISVINNNYTMGNHFSYQQLKTRIVMMNKQKSSNINSLKMLSVIPILVVSLTAFNKSEEVKLPKNSIQATIEKVALAVIESNTIPVAETTEIKHPKYLNLIETDSLNKNNKMKMVLQMDKDTITKVTITNDSTKTNIVITGIEGRQPIYVIDGVVQIGSEKGTLNISPENIDFVFALKPEQAILKYGDKGKNGAIEIKTKSARDVATRTLTATIQMRNALYVVNNTETTLSQVDTLRANDVEAIEVFKGEKALAIYGEKGKNGVVKITTKKK